MGCSNQTPAGDLADYHERLELALVEAHAALRDEGLVLADVTLAKNAQSGFNAAWEADVRRRETERRNQSFTGLAEALQNDGDTQT